MKLPLLTVPKVKTVQKFYVRKHYLDAVLMVFPRPRVTITKAVLLKPQPWSTVAKIHSKCKIHMYIIRWRKITFSIWKLNINWIVKFCKFSSLGKLISYLKLEDEFLLTLSRVVSQTVHSFFHTSQSVFFLMHVQKSWTTRMSWKFCGKMKMKKVQLFYAHHFLCSHYKFPLQRLKGP